jgi:hypothetical protein
MFKLNEHSFKNSNFNQSFNFNASLYIFKIGPFFYIPGKAMQEMAEVIQLLGY